MNRRIIPPRHLTRMQDGGLARSESHAATQEARRRYAGDPRRRGIAALGRFLRFLAHEFAASWTAARERRQTLKVLKRVDRRLLRDLGIERGQLREVVDAMAAPQGAERCKDNTSGQQPCLVESNWMEARPAG